MNMLRKNKVLHLSILSLTVFSLIFISAITSFAVQGAPGSAPTVQPKVGPMGGTIGGSSDCSDAESIAPLSDVGVSLHGWSRSHGGSCCWKCLVECNYVRSGPAVGQQRCQDRRWCD